MGVIVLVRHGQSQWNLENRFAGWVDVPLTEQGRRDATTCARELREFSFDRAFTSHLQRAADTLTIILRELRQESIPVEADSALNERHYGDLQGLNKAETAVKYGQEQVRVWRRSFFTRPPNGESMEDCEKRTLPYFLHIVLPLVGKGETVLLVAHGNSLRPMIKHLNGLGPEAAATMEIGLCIPYIYWFDGGKVVKGEVREIPGIVMKGASQTEAVVAGGRV